MLRSQQLQRKIQAIQHKLQQLSTLDICNILLAFRSRTPHHWEVRKTEL